MQSNHVKFLESLRASDKPRWIVAMWLCSLGYVVTLRPQKEAPTHQEWRNYTDEGDIEAIDLSGNKLRIEVKGRSLSFTCKEDFKYPDIIVCAKHSWDNAEIKPHAYISLNKELTHVAIVKGDSFLDWRIDGLDDRRYVEHHQICYYAPLSAVKFMKIRMNHERETATATENMSVR